MKLIRWLGQPKLALCVGGYALATGLFIPNTFWSILNLAVGAYLILTSWNRVKNYD